MLFRITIFRKYHRKAKYSGTVEETISFSAPWAGDSKAAFPLFRWIIWTQMV